MISTASSSSKWDASSETADNRCLDEIGLRPYHKKKSF
jgi:hypothetical protein